MGHHFPHRHLHIWGIRSGFSTIRRLGKCLFSHKKENPFVSECGVEFQDK